MLAAQRHREETAARAAAAARAEVIRARQAQELRPASRGFGGGFAGGLGGPGLGTN